MRKQKILFFAALLSASTVMAQAENYINLDQLQASEVNLNQEIPVQNKAAGDCNIGNESTDDFFITTGNFGANYIAGYKYTLGEEGVLNSINVVTQSTGIANVKMAVYDDLGGAPNNLVSESLGSAPVIIGTVSLPVSPVVLPAGDYWIMIRFDVEGQHCKRKLAAGNISFYQALPFDSPPPANASSFIQTIPNTDNPYFLDITCSTSIGIDELENKISSIYPNPTSENVTIETSELIFMENIEIIDATGRNVKSIQINQLTQTNIIDVSDITPGMYSIKISGDNQVIVKSIIIE